MRDVTSIEIDLRELLRSREEENKLLKDKLGRSKKIRFEEDGYGKERSDKCAKLEEELRDMKIKYSDREKDLETSVEMAKQQIQDWEEKKVNEMVSIA